MSGWLENTSETNLFKQAYVKGFVDVSGGDIINRTGNLVIQNDSSLNGRLFVLGDVSLNSNLYIKKDLTITGRLSVENYTNSNIIYTNVTTTNFTLIVAEDLSLSGGFNVEKDASLNSRLFVNGDVSLNSRLFVSSDVSLNSRLFVSGDSSFNGNTYVLQRSILQGDVSMNSCLFVNGDVSMNSRLFISSDVSLGARLFVSGDASMNGNMYVSQRSILQGDVSMNSRLFINGDVSMNSRLFINGDVSMNSRLFVGGDIAISGDIIPTLANTFSLGSAAYPFKSLFVSPATIYFVDENNANNNGTLSYNGTSGELEIEGNSEDSTTAVKKKIVISTNGKVALGKSKAKATLDVSGNFFLFGDASLNGRIFTFGDVSMNSRLFINGDSSMNGNLYVSQMSILEGDVSMNSRLFINGDVSMNSRLFVSSDVSLGARLFVSGDASMNGNVYTLGQSISEGDVSMNSRLFINGDVSMNSRLFVSSDVSLGARLFVSNDFIIDGDISLNSGMSIAGDVSLNSRVFISGDISLNGNIYLSSSGNVFVDGKTIGLNVSEYNSELSTTGNSFIGVNNLKFDTEAGFTVTDEGSGSILVGMNSTFKYWDISGQESGNLTAAGLDRVVFIPGKNITLSSDPTDNPNGNTKTMSIGTENLVDVDSDQLITGSKYFLNDVSINGRLYVSGDVSMNSRLFVSGDSSFNGNLYVNGTTIEDGDVSMNSRLYLSGNLYLNENSSIYVGGVVLALSTNSSVTTSSSTVTYDNWTLNNIVNAPSAVTIGSITATSTTIVIPWTYPTQINTGVFSYPLPYLSALTVSYSYYNGSSTVTGYALQNVSGNNYISTSASNSNGTAITAVVLTNNSSATTGYGQITVSGSTRYAFTYYNSGFASLSSDNNSISIKYSNNSLSTSASVSTSSFTAFIAGGVPGQVLSLTISSSNNSNNIVITFSYSAPTLYDVTNNVATSASTPISAYKIIYSSIASSTRYGTAVSDSGTTINQSGTNYSTTLSYPDTTYTFVVSARNSLNTNYGTTATTTVSTTSINPTRSFESIGFPASPYTNATASLVSNNTSISNVYFGTSAVDWTSNSFKSPIQKATNRGSTGSNLLTINVALGTNTATSNYSGFPTTNPGNVSVTGLSIITSIPTDSYSASSVGYQGFYLETTDQVVIKAAAISASSNQNTLTVTQSQAGSLSATNSFSFYFDTYVTPSVSSFTTSIYPTGTTSIQICGIWILYGTARLNANTVATGIGNYFYNSTKILQYSSGSAVTTESGLSNVVGKTTPLAASNTITNNSGPIQYSTSTYSTSIPSTTVTAYNQIGTSANGTSSAISVIFDQPTYTLYAALPSVVTSSLLSTSASYGFRVYSGTPLSGSTVPSYLYGGSTSYKAIPFDNAWSLVNNSNTGGYDGTQELLLANGAFRTSNTNYATSYTSYNYSTGSAVAQNTVNYTSLGSSGYRFMTFAQKVYISAGTTYSYLNVVFNNVSTFNQSSLLYAGDSSTKILVYYRMEDTTNNTTLQMGGSELNTWWISLNDNITNSGNAGQPAAGSANVIPSSNLPYYPPGSLNISLSGSTVTIKVLLTTGLSTNYSSVANGYLYSYLRIGLPMSISTCSIGNVQAYLSAS